MAYRLTGERNWAFQWSNWTKRLLGRSCREEFQGWNSSVPWCPVGSALSTSAPQHVDSGHRCPNSRKLDIEIQKRLGGQVRLTVCKRTYGWHAVRTWVLKIRCMLEEEWRRGRHNNISLSIPDQSVTPPPLFFALPPPVWIVCRHSVKKAVPFRSFFVFLFCGVSLFLFLWPDTHTHTSLPPGWPKWRCFIHSSVCCYTDLRIWSSLLVSYVLYCCCHTAEFLVSYESGGGAAAGAFGAWTATILLWVPSVVGVFLYFGWSGPTYPTYALHITHTTTHNNSAILMEQSMAREFVCSV